MTSFLRILALKEQSTRNCLTIPIFLINDKTFTLLKILFALLKIAPLYPNVVVCLY